MFSGEAIEELASKIARLLDDKLLKDARPRLMDVAQAFRYLGLKTENALRIKVSKGQIPKQCIKKIGGSTYFDRLECDKWIDGI